MILEINRNQSPSSWVSIDFHWFSLINIDFHWLLLINIDFHWILKSRFTFPRATHHWSWNMTLIKYIQCPDIYYEESFIHGQLLKRFKVKKQQKHYFLFRIVYPFWIGYAQGFYYVLRLGRINKLGLYVAELPPITGHLKRVTTYYPLFLKQWNPVNTG